MPIKKNKWRKPYRQHLKTMLGLTRVADIPTSFVVWAGLSQLDGTPIMVVASCVRDPSGNIKTGDAIQVSIMRQDMNPMDAWKQGLDGAVCPDACIHRSKPRGGDGTCYVNKARLADAWAGAVRRLQHGQPMATTEHPGVMGGRMFAGAVVRFGMEGDPSAVPLHVWQAMAKHAKRWMGYTASWRTLDPAWAELFMASCSTPADALRARSKGWRVFAASASPELDAGFQDAGLRMCLAESNALTCVTCGGCDGTAKGAKRPGWYLSLHGAVGAAKRRASS